MKPEPTYPPAVASVLAHNRAFVARGDWRDHAAPGRPAKQLAVVTCMDTRLTRLLPDALGLQNGDAKIIKVAGATIVEPYGEVMRSLLVAVAELGVTDVMVVGHTSCGTCGMEAAHMLEELGRAGVPRERIEAAIARDPRAASLLNGFEDLEDEVRASVRKVREHPLMPDGVRVWGFTIDIETGELTAVAPGAGESAAAGELTAVAPGAESPAAPSQLTAAALDAGKPAMPSDPASPAAEHPAL